MKMIKKFSIFIILLSLCMYVYAATSFDVPQNELAASKPTLSFSTTLAGLTFSEVGFSSTAVTGLGGKATAINTVKISESILDASENETGMFETKSFYIYWKFLGASENFPKIILRQSGKLDNASIPDHKVDWIVSLDDVDVLDTSDSTFNEYVVFPRENPVAEGTGQATLSSKNGCSALKLRTQDVFWKYPDAVYSSELWLVVQTN